MQKRLSLCALVFIGLASTAWAQLPGHPAGTLYQITPVFPQPQQAPVIRVDTVYLPAPVIAAQEARPDTLPWRNSLSLMPASLLAQGVELALEHRLALTDNTFRLNLGIFGGRRPWAYDVEALYAYRLEGQYRFHFLQHAFARQGAYLGMYFMAKHMRFMIPGPSGFEDDLLPRYSSVVGAGFLAGYQVRGRRGFVADLFVGGGYLAPMYQEMAQAHRPLLNPMNEGLAVRAGLSLGYLLGKRPMRAY